MHPHGCRHIRQVASSAIVGIRRVTLWFESALWLSVPLVDNCSIEYHSCLPLHLSLRWDIELALLLSLWHSLFWLIRCQFTWQIDVRSISWRHIVEGTHIDCPRRRSIAANKIHAGSGCDRLARLGSFDLAVESVTKIFRGLKVHVILISKATKELFSSLITTELLILFSLSSLDQCCSLDFKFFGTTLHSALSFLIEASQIFIPWWLIWTLLVKKSDFASIVLRAE